MKTTIHKAIFPVLIVSVLLALVTVSCETQHDDPYDIGKDKIQFNDTPYNQDLSSLSKAVSASLVSNKEFRKLVKEEALIMFDGDYDILLSDFSDQTIDQPANSLKSGSDLGNTTVRGLLNMNLKETETNVRLKSAVSPLDELIEKYPYLQITIPVHAEDWDSENYMPDVTFIPEEFDEATTLYVTGYSEDGTEVLIDAVNPPDVPVIVISMNERVDIEYIDKGTGTPATPTSLSGSLTESGIRINWVMPDTTSPLNTTGFYVYRKTSIDFTYIKVATIVGAFNRSYDDNSVVANNVYSYYVQSYYQSESSGASNYFTITAPQRPKPVVSFDAIQHAKTEVELRWEYDQSQAIIASKLYKYVVGESAGYYLLGSFTPNQHDYFDRDIAIGKKIIYKIVDSSALGISNPKYDFVQAPYRDLSKKSPIYIKQLKFESKINEIESWIAGKPEFYVTVTNVDKGNKSPFIVQENMDFDFDSRSKESQIFNGKKVLDWQPGFWYDMLTFTAIEYDRSSGTLKVKIGVGFNTKDTLKLGFIDGSAGVDYTITFNDKGEECGNSFLDYYDIPEGWIEFPNFGLKIKISESDI